MATPIALQQSRLDLRFHSGAVRATIWACEVTPGARQQGSTRRALIHGFPTLTAPGRSGWMGSGSTWDKTGGG